MNVVFDLGGVLLTWDPPAIVSSLFGDSDTQQLVLDQVFRQPDWLDLDRGANMQIELQNWFVRFDQHIETNLKALYDFQAEVAKPAVFLTGTLLPELDSIVAGIKSYMVAEIPAAISKAYWH